MGARLANALGIEKKKKEKGKGSSISLFVQTDVCLGGGLLSIPSCLHVSFFSFHFFSSFRAKGRGAGGILN